MYYVNPYIKDLYRVKYHDDREGVLRLDMNESPVGLPEEVVAGVKEKITPDYISTYPQKDELVRILAEHNRISPENISVTGGSDEAMRLIFQCFAKPEGEVLTVSPTFEMYDVYSKMFGMKHVEVSYNEEFEVSPEEILAAINSETSLVILLNPNSPIGTAYSEKEVREIIELSAKNGAIVVVDEAYHYYMENTVMGMIGEYDNLLVLRTFSKLCAIAGLRIGYVSGNEQLIHYIENAESTFNVNNVAILFAKEIMQTPGLLDRLYDTWKEGHEYALYALKRLGYRVQSGYGNYILFWPNKDSKKLIAELKEKDVWVRDYGRGVLKGWVRVSTGDRQSMERFVQALQLVDHD
ncbi:MAG: aminotransferase class I/II-fold pyridoxal phosphate-dependent enzyme [Lachnospiraceae bacterium]|nr:aminotransferase class I/II-fold pyridoxal phosphate-dependent enzyme [Lachnospiraceae bacterium]